MKIFSHLRGFDAKLMQVFMAGVGRI
ncbi:uncharacterized protein METZ01_LOCUS285701 [marine metagenome]|uniref:Uncharacterized protein n=1 Tax=marine metagenome TaxID=408172 RepID=A0A382LCL0_9ZZZZ